jgi:hypothetical protein
VSTGNSKSYEPSLGEFNNAAIERIDYAIATVRTVFAGMHFM